MVAPGPSHLPEGRTRDSVSNPYSNSQAVKNTVGTHNNYENFNQFNYKSLVWPNENRHHLGFESMRIMTAANNIILHKRNRK